MLGTREDCEPALCRSSSTMLRHRLLLTSRPPLTSPFRIRDRISIYGMEYFSQTGLRCSPRFPADQASQTSLQCLSVQSSYPSA